jgi:hypothetical protein
MSAAGMRPGLVIGSWREREGAHSTHERLGEVVLAMGERAAL